MNKRFRKVLIKWKVFSFLKALRRVVNFKKVVRIGSSRLLGVSIYGSTVSVSEPWMRVVLQSVMPLRPGVFVDVGANLGQTLLYVKSVDKFRGYIGFEPNPNCNMVLQELVRYNNWGDVRIVPVGLFPETSILKLDLYDDDLTNSGGSLVEHYWKWSGKSPKRSLFVPLMSFETIEKFLEIAQIGIIKIDVEGAEAEVLETLFKRIQKDRPLIIFELLSAYSEENTLRIERQARVHRLILDAGYLVFRIIESSKGELEHLQEIESFDPLFDPNMCNYLAIPKGAVDELASVFGDRIKAA